MVAEYVQYEGDLLTKGELAEKFAREFPGMTWTKLHDLIKKQSGVNLSMSTVKLAMLRVKNSQKVSVEAIRRRVVDSRKANGDVLTGSMPAAQTLPVKQLEENPPLMVDTILAAIDVVRKLVVDLGGKEAVKRLLDHVC